MCNLYAINYSCYGILHVGVLVQNLSVKYVGGNMEFYRISWSWISSDVSTVTFCVNITNVASRRTLASVCDLNSTHFEYRNISRGVQYEVVVKPDHERGDVSKKQFPGMYLQLSGKRESLKMTIDLLML